ncbi:MAG: lipoyl(octanoyl) transferase LipB [Proteobacteria bacterium]|nr:lipoyl(octanoyl) transferase LipB [Pseudomonadota bacterium]
MSFGDGLACQERAVEFVRSSEGSKGLVLGLEHPAVITLGKRGTSEDVYQRDSRVPVVQVDRGGQATLHHPGQLVIYPILNFQNMGFQPRTWVEFLLRVTQGTLEKLGVATEHSDGAGLETKRGKIAFLGVRLRQGMSTHGLSINCCNDLQQFQWIRPCGVQGRALDKLENWAIKHSPEDVFKLWVEEFSLLTRASDLGITRGHSKSSLGVVGSAFP